MLGTLHPAIADGGLFPRRPAPEYVLAGEMDDSIEAADQRRINGLQRIPGNLIRTASHARLEPNHVMALRLQRRQQGRAYGPRRAAGKNSHHSSIQAWIVKVC